MLVTYKNNRLIPALIIATCFILFYCLVDPSLENYGYNPVVKQKGIVVEEVELSGSQRKPVEVDTGSTAETAKAPANEVQYVAPTSSHKTTDKEKEPSKAISYNGLSTDDVLLIVKTGGTTIWKRMLVHLTTSLSHDRIPWTTPSSTPMCRNGLAPSTSSTC
ncbi:hypothetical protein TrVFT333_009033 [Trichoderma virens FT-333]|nr:hypothetical protein TrVFT333_009033 [Trichoderma virens FT-333]